jgi:hypothetical protein
MGEGSSVTTWVQLSALPAVFLFWMGFLFVTGKRTGVRLAVAFFVLLYAVGLMRVVSATEGNARMRVVLLPYEAVIAGSLVLGFAYGWKSANPAGKVAGRLCLTAAVLLVAFVAIGVI